MTSKDVTLLIADPRHPINAKALLQSLHHTDTLRFGATKYIGADLLEDGKPAYDIFMVTELHKHFDTSHVLVMQLDGYITHPELWNNDWLQYDYIGAPWMPGHQPCAVGNGGFSLRSRRFQEWLSDYIAANGWKPLPDDIVISVNAHDDAVAAGFTYAPVSVAEIFSKEQPLPTRSLKVPTFGFHGAEARQYITNVPHKPRNPGDGQP